VIQDDEGDLQADKKKDQSKIDKSTITTIKTVKKIHTDKGKDEEPIGYCELSSGDPPISG